MFKWSDHILWSYDLHAPPHSLGYSGPCLQASHVKGSDQLIVTLYTPSIYAYVQKQLIRTFSGGWPVHTQTVSLEIYNPASFIIHGCYYVLIQCTVSVHTAYNGWELWNGLYLDKYIWIIQHVCIICLLRILPFILFCSHSIVWNGLYNTKQSILVKKCLHFLLYSLHPIHPFPIVSITVLRVSHCSRCSFSMMVKWANDGLLQVNDGKNALNGREMSVWSYTHFTIIDKHFTIINEHFTILSLK